MKTKELPVKQINFVRCTTCGAGTGEPCELHTGTLRFEPHRARKLSAADALETNRIKRQSAITSVLCDTLNAV
jgi:hypothetical protein